MKYTPYYKPPTKFQRAKAKMAAHRGHAKQLALNVIVSLIISLAVRFFF